MKDLIIYIYKDSYITFTNNGDRVLINADEMAKPFGKKPEEWLQLPDTIESFNYAYKQGFQPYKIQKRNKKTTCTLLVDIYAIAFARWLSLEFYFWFNETLEQYYKTYLTPTKHPEDTLLITPEGQEKIRETMKVQQREVEEQKAATALTNAYMNTTITVPVGRLAKILRDNGHKTLTIDGVAKSMNQTNMLEWLRKNNVFDDKYTSFNAPKMEYILRGFFELTTYVRCKEGMMEYLNVPKVTGKGLVYYVNYFLTGKYPNIEGF